MIYCIIGRNGVCNNDFSSGCYKCRMALCYDDSREVMGLQECVRQAMELISVLQKESVSPAAFLKRHNRLEAAYDSDIGMSEEPTMS